MTDKTPPKRFFEPVYMNEDMVLNASAYLFSGILDSATERSGKETTNATSGNLGGNFLGFAIGLKGSHAGNTTSQQETLRRFTVGGLHMEVIDELEVQGLVTTIEDISGDAVERTNGDDGFFHANVILQPTEYWATLQVLQIALPLITQIISNYSDLIVRNIPEGENSRIGAELLEDIENIRTVSDLRLTVL